MHAGVRAQCVRDGNDWSLTLLLAGVLVDDQRLSAGRAAILTEAYEKNRRAPAVCLPALSSYGPAHKRLLTYSYRPAGYAALL